MGYECEYEITELCDRISILLRAAVARRRFPLVASDVWSAIGKLRKTYGLEKPTNELLRNNPSGPREKWISIAPPGKIVFFDDKGYQLFSMSDNMVSLTSRLSIGPGSLAYGLDNEGFLFEVTHPASNGRKSACAERQPLAPRRLTRPPSKRHYGKRKKA